MAVTGGSATARSRGPRSTGDFDYESLGAGYSKFRRADTRIASYVETALGDARTVLNVGAGTGSYEPQDRYVVAVEPSASMRSQRPPTAVPAIDASAEHLPFDDDCFDAGMAMVTVHQWALPEQGLRELRRVSRGPVLVLTLDRDALDRLWLAQYVPELIAAERKRFPPIGWICGVLGGNATVVPVPVPIDCTDGFAEAFYARPEALLDPEIRGCQSGWAFVAPGTEDRFVADLRADLASGAWESAHGGLRAQREFEGALRLVVARR